MTYIFENGILYNDEEFSKHNVEIICQKINRHEDKLNFDHVLYY